MKPAMPIWFAPSMSRRVETLIACAGIAVGVGMGVGVAVTVGEGVIVGVGVGIPVPPKLAAPRRQTPHCGFATSVAVLGPGEIGLNLTKTDWEGNGSVEEIIVKLSASGPVREQFDETPWTFWTLKTTGSELSPTATDPKSWASGKM